MRNTVGKNVTAIFLYSFALLRPVATTKFFVANSIGGMKLIELFGIGTSYLAMVMLLINLRRQRLDVLSFLVLYLCLYMALSILWGSSPKEISRIILPFVIFFIARSFVDIGEKIKNVAFFSIVGFLAPLFASTFMIALGKSVWKTNYWTGLPRYEGIYSGPHSLGHNMLICLVFLAIWHYFRLQQNDRSVSATVMFYGLGLLCLYAIFKSYTRTAYVSLVFFMGIYLYGRKKYRVLASLAAVAVLVVLFSSTFQTIFWDVLQPLDGKDLAISKMGSGRIGGWSTIFTQFLTNSLPLQIRGLGITKGATITAGAHFGGSHNDLLAMVICFGYIGFTLYAGMFLILITKTSRMKTDMWLKGIFLGFFVMVGVANIFSNSYLTRFELGQSFCLLAGSLMGLMDRENRKTH